MSSQSFFATLKLFGDSEDISKVLNLLLVQIEFQVLDMCIQYNCVLLTLCHVLVSATNRIYSRIRRVKWGTEIPEKWRLSSETVIFLKSIDLSLVLPRVEKKGVTMYGMRVILCIFVRVLTNFQQLLPKVFRVDTTPFDSTLWSVKGDRAWLNLAVSSYYKEYTLGHLATNFNFTLSKA